MVVVSWSLSHGRRLLVLGRPWGFSFPPASSGHTQNFLLAARIPSRLSPVYWSSCIYLYIFITTLFSNLLISSPFFSFCCLSCPSSPSTWGGFFFLSLFVISNHMYEEGGGEKPCQEKNKEMFDTIHF